MIVTTEYNIANTLLKTLYDEQMRPAAAASSAAVADVARMTQSLSVSDDLEEDQTAGAGAVGGESEASTTASYEVSVAPQNCRFIKITSN